ncbi:helix-turn-helix domain-containing protein [Aquabacterium sp. A7-Y]|uniref:helix-turn-helix domain-containing protein n=1 Tax=Aquabacterium sp. A7-Y TaxID=1349605 RepID=UPI00223E4E17|nr:helix-turn-helix transcriptional regulator [Aquabacterium sp. A7-Y]MCW7541018.1 helix-turn-helix domain-containing protein [Aquabacterium sp. A7-Y]
MDLLVAFGRVVRDERKRKQLSQEKLAEAADLHRNYIGLVELGKTAAALDSAAAIANALGLRLSELLRAAEEYGEASGHS